MCKQLLGEYTSIDAIVPRWHMGTIISHQKLAYGGGDAKTWPIRHKRQPHLHALSPVHYERGFTDRAKVIHISVDDSLTPLPA